MTKISMDKKYRYRNGEPARVLCVDGGDREEPVISLTEDGYTRRHNENGRRWDEKAEDEFDLIEVKPPEYRWFNVYWDSDVPVVLRTSKATADQAAGAERIACIKIDINEIEGRFDD